jgi:enterochelin esterase-like enzyme
VLKMHKDAKTGVWSYTTSLPSGIFNYGFYVNCTSASQTGCTELPDPHDPAFNVRKHQSVGSTASVSQVYVPSDPSFETTDASWLAPATKHGTVTERTYTSPLSTDPAGKNYLAVYTPPGYDAKRAAQYPTLYLSHGGGGNETDWMTQGSAGNILDNLIDEGQIEPMVVVMTNFNGFGAGCGTSSWETDYDTNLIDAVIPYVQSQYDVSASASQRAFSGLSCGGDLTGTLVANDAAEFGSFGIMSPGPNTIPALTATQAAAIKQDAVFVGGGWQDPIHAWALSDLQTVQTAGGEVVPDFVNGGHEWYVWRQLLRTFLTNVAFHPNVG